MRTATIEKTCALSHKEVHVTRCLHSQLYGLGRVTCPEPVPHLSSEEQQNLREDGYGSRPRYPGPWDNWWLQLGRSLDKEQGRFLLAAKPRPTHFGLSNFSRGQPLRTEGQQMGVAQSIPSRGPCAMGGTTPVLELSTVRPRLLSWACTTEFAGMLLWGGMQRCLLWEIRTFPMFPGAGNLAPQSHPADSPWDHSHSPGSH